MINRQRNRWLAVERTGLIVAARTQFDLALGYTPSKHLSFTGGIINLNDSHEDAYYQNTAIFQMASRTGRTFYVSATSKF